MWTSVFTAHHCTSEAVVDCQSFHPVEEMQEEQQQVQLLLLKRFLYSESVSSTTVLTSAAINRLVGELVSGCQGGGLHWCSPDRRWKVLTVSAAWSLPSLTSNGQKTNRTETVATVTCCLSFAANCSMAPPVGSSATSPARVQEKQWRKWNFKKSGPEKESGLASGWPGCLLWCLWRSCSSKKFIRTAEVVCRSFLTSAVDTEGTQLLLRVHNNFTAKCWEDQSVCTVVQCGVKWVELIWLGTAPHQKDADVYPIILTA